MRKFEEIASNMGVYSDMMVIIFFATRRRHTSCLSGWSSDVCFSDLDEPVVAFARHRDRLAEFFRVTTPCWNTVKWAWDKKNTYDRAVELGILVPHTSNPRNEEELSALYSRLPL